MTAGRTANEQPRGFIAKFGPSDQRLIRAVRKALRAFFPTANELVRDNYNGSGKQTRFIRLDSVDVLARADVQALLTAAIAQAKAPFPRAGRGQLIIRSVSAKQRPRVARR